VQAWTSGAAPEWATSSVRASLASRRRLHRSSTFAEHPDISGEAPFSPCLVCISSVGGPLLLSRNAIHPVAEVHRDVGELLLRQLFGKLTHPPPVRPRGDGVA
jgi:hypothetical protein